mmetsp:Transcript_104639/g.144768  ORF Transcript_104639/g.144768 Transcript_104639/m.144768 type:complete len:86 (+) Transcript_104639:232-489(+)
MVLLLFSMITLVAVLPFADLILFTTVGAITIVCNAIFSAYFLKEPFTKYDVFAVTLILAGTTSIVMQSHISEEPLDRETIVALMG